MTEFIVRNEIQLGAFLRRERKLAGLRQGAMGGISSCVSELLFRYPKIIITLKRNLKMRVGKKLIKTMA